MTINQSYTPAQRQEIAKELRDIEAATHWLNLPSICVSYIRKILWQYNAKYFSTFLLDRNFDIQNYPGGPEAYIREALSRLADELEACK